MILLNKSDNLHKKFEKINLVLFDLQGTLLPQNKEDDEVYHSLLIYKLKEFTELCQKFGIRVGIVSGSTQTKLTEVMKNIEQCELLFSSLDKVSQAKSILKKFHIEFENIFFVGDELFDLPLLRIAGISAAPSDARREVKRGVQHILEVPGGIEVLEYMQKVITFYRKDVKMESISFIKKLFSKDN